MRATAATTRSTRDVPWVLGPVYIVPLCKNGPGNVGWLDWTPPGGGTSELICSIQTPNNPAIDLPSWQYVTETGNVNSTGVETALRAYDGEVVLIPQFDQTCGPGPHGTPDSSKPAINTPPNYGCPAGALGGNGNNQWYRFPSFAYFQMCSNADTECVNLGVPHGAYVNGNNSECDTGNGATSCLAGKFVEILGSGTVGPGRRRRDDRHQGDRDPAHPMTAIAPAGGLKESRDERRGSSLSPAPVPRQDFRSVLLGSSTDLCAMSPARCRWDAQGRRGQEE